MSRLRSGLWVLAAVLAAAALAPGPLRARALSWNALPAGYVIDARDLIDTLGRGAVVAGRANDSACALRLPAMPATVERQSDPAHLLLSNAPEELSPLSLPRRQGLLVRASVPAGACRILVSHENQCGLPLDLVLRMTNPSMQNVVVTLSPRAAARQDPIPGSYRMNAAVGGTLVEHWFADARRVAADGQWHPADGDRRRILGPRQQSDAVLVASFRGLAAGEALLTTTAPLTLAVYATPSGYAPEAGAPVLLRTGSQARGLFDRPDVMVKAACDLSGGRPLRFVFGGAERNNAMGLLDEGTWMTGLDTTRPGHADPQVDRGDFGGFTTFEADLTADPRCPYRTALMLAVCGGRKAAVLPDDAHHAVVLSQWSALVLGRARAGERFRYVFTLPPNSWAPIYLVAVPLASP